MTVCGALATLVLPAASVWVALNTHTLLAAKAVCALGGLAVSMAHTPLALAVAVKLRLLPSVARAFTVMVALASALLPATVGALLTLVVSVAMLSAAASVSTVRFSTLEVVLVVTSLALMRCSPGARLAVGVKVHTRLASAVALPSKMPPSNTCTLPLAVRATPVRVGAVRLVMASPTVPLSLALAKAAKPIWVASTVKV